MKSIISIVVFISFLLLFGFFKLETSNLFDQLVNLLSISIGFTVTALSIIATSKFSKRLYSLESKNKTKTLLHELIDRHKSSLNMFFFSLSSILIYGFFDDKVLNLKIISNFNFSYSDLFQACIWFIFCIAFLKFYQLVQLFCKLVIQNSK